MMESVGMLRSLQRDRWLAFLVLISLVVLLVIVVRSFGVGLPQYPATGPRPASELASISVREYELMFLAEAVPRLQPVTNGWNGFYTKHFEPPPKPPKKPVTTRQVTLVYRGLFQSDSGVRKAFVDVDGQVKVLLRGASVVADLGVASIERETLTLTNANAKAHQLAFDVPQKLEVPLK